MSIEKILEAKRDFTLRPNKYEDFMHDDPIVDECIKYLELNYSGNFADFQIKSKFTKQKGLSAKKWEAIAKPKAFGLDDVVASKDELGEALVSLGRKLRRYKVPEQNLNIGMFQ